jgi:uncharacterized coiled-coil protein SlyX
MASFNAEIAFKALEKRVDRFDTMLTAIEKQVKVLVETRGASKEKAVEELLKTLPAMRDADQKLQANLSALAGQMSKEKADFARLGAVAQATLSKEFEAAQKEQEASLDALEKQLGTRMDAQMRQAATLNEQLSERLNRSQQEARARMENAFEAKIATLRGQVQVLEAKVAALLR